MAKGESTYQVLARKWRPQRFEEVVGQEGTVQALKNAIKMGRIAHAFLFSGPRGTGKTTIARLLAKAINCEKGPTPDPCGKCRSCQAITSGIDFDVHEIDGAAYRVVGDAEELRERTRLMPAGSRFKIYIVDEVHMFSGHAFNVLLKTLEEPPAHVKFIFATTEPHKMPATILSRCQRFELRRLSVEKMVARLKKIAESEGIEIEEEALATIARRAEGAMRDAESILDQVISYCGKKIQAEDVTSLLGLVRTETFYEIDRAILDGNVEAVLRVASGIFSEGKHVQHFVDELIEHYRQMLIANATAEPGRILEVSADELKRLSEMAGNFSEDQLLHAIDLLADAQMKLARPGSQQIVLEVALVQLVRSRDRISIDDLVKKLDEVQAKGGGGGLSLEDVGVNIGAQGSPQPDLFSSATGSAMVKESPLTPVSEEEAKDFGKVWDRVLDAVGRTRPSLKETLAFARVMNLENGVLTLGFDRGHTFHRTRIADKENRRMLENVVSETLGSPVRLEVEEATQPTPSAAATEQNVEEIPVVKNVLEIFGGKVVKRGR